MAYFHQDEDEKGEPTGYSGMLNDQAPVGAQAMAQNQAATSAASTAQGTADQNGPIGNGAGAPNRTASGYLNFSDFANANSGTARSQAQALNKSTLSGSEAAQAAQAGAVSQFGADTKNGTVRASGATKTGTQVADEQRGAARQAGSDATPQTTTTQSPNETAPGAPQTVQSSTQALSGASTRDQNSDASRDGLGDRQAGDPGDARQQDIGGGVGGVGYNAALDAQQTGQLENDPSHWAQLKDAQYTGPSSLQDSSGYAGLLDQTNAAQGQVDAIGANHGGDVNSGVQAALGPQANQWDAAAVGAYGRPDFQQTHDMYEDGGTRGSLKTQLNNAQASSALLGSQAKQQSDANAAGYGHMLSDYDAENGKLADQDAAETAARGTALDRANNSLMRTASFRQNADPTLASGFARAHEMIDPAAAVARAAGKSTPEELINKQIEGAAGVGTGSQGWSGAADVWNGSDPAEMALYQSMTPDQQTEFDSLDPAEQRKWIADHKGGA